MKWRDSPRVPKPREALDPYRFPGIRDLEDTGGVPDARRREPSPIPEPQERPRDRTDEAHHRRLELHAALTAAGIPPLPGDLHAIEAVSALDEATNAAVRRWVAGGR
ncbi:hypothetical protein [Streptomyces roseus]|uniref:Uncharacterized protein n=1 Tax=Streptomyces roseus TaxID=66430 RepID=A0A0J6XIM8_9ACTN|nr:hypothetical protein [Streptomyces roseus]KMO95029.1 hypothetical protein ACS04_25835 [Streptomyces roseus]